jgi:uncharacterized membrane protein
MLLALLALIGVFLAAYLTMYKLGYVGQLVCAIGSCERVQTSRWSILLGMPVAAWGVGFYLVVLTVAVAGTQERLADSRTVSSVLLGLTGWGVLFSGYLTYLELFAIHAICEYCVSSAALVTVMFLIALSDARRTASPQRVGALTPSVSGGSPRR